ncbi:MULTISPECIES: hypothetical protein [Tetragenococcus]|uniref:Uncharacterized protein n=1 Tax=Tetragenococcus muriaticus 3MR10-3 TaxID=1302648 RepID=A0A091C720_9ENTE|nr:MULTISPECIES: hypothetical protein [Tetragenococcus]KFN91872.1 hypothetical protein TMU3MR103_0830 [Tetragenococcus muriaticus 3MR10-3]MCF1675988.1 hypothetical protein [Tetragenococcus halophilus]MDN6541923.1 hypothetical protein [Tetragenococcus koreensis]
MNFTNLKHFLSDNVQTVLLLLGFLCIVLAIIFLTNIFYGLLALGIILIGIAFRINYEKGG